MNKIREFIVRYKNLIFFSLLGASCTFGVYVGYITVDRYQVIVSGVLGLSTLYLLNLEFLSSKRISNKRSGIRIELPKDLIYLVYGFFLTIIMFWAMIQVIHVFGFMAEFIKS